ncbi:MAG: hypothetical protein K2Y71_17580 [Xanthobacteraceae bacterium]|nr:hypothetical protein [Xanthobacteraceae bacterium]
MADNSGSSALGVLVGAILVLVLVFGGFMLFNQSGGGSKGPSVTISTTK